MYSLNEKLDGWITQHVSTLEERIIGLKMRGYYLKYRRGREIHRERVRCRVIGIFVAVVHRAVTLSRKLWENEQGGQRKDFFPET